MAKKKEPIVTLGLTRRQFDEIKLRRLSNDLEMIPGNCAGEMKDKYFNEDFKDYQLPMHERNHVHVAMELRLFNQATGERLSSPMIQKFEAESWKAMKNSDVFKTYVSEFVHNPALEKKDAPLVTLLYVLTEEEIAAKEKEELEALKKQKADNGSDQDQGENIGGELNQSNPPELLSQEGEAITGSDEAPSAAPKKKVTAKKAGK